MGGDGGGRVVVDAEHRAAAAEEQRAAVTQSAADVEEPTRADAVEHLAVAGGVERQQGVGGLALDGTLSGESQLAPFGPDGAGSLRTPWPTLAPTLWPSWGIWQRRPGSATSTCSRGATSRMSRRAAPSCMRQRSRRLWAEAGIEVTIRTSYAQGHPPESHRDGVHVIRRAGRYLVFPRGDLQRDERSPRAP